MAKRPPAIAVRVLGALEISVGGAARPLRPRDWAVLLVVLRAPARRARRDRLCAYLWPDFERRAARHSLSQAIYRINGLLGGRRLLGVGELVSLNVDSLAVDVEDFDDLYNEERWEAAVAAYGGEFAAGLSINATAFDRWRSDEADLLNVRFGRARDYFIEEMAARGKWNDIIEEVRRLPDLNLTPIARRWRGAALRMLAAVQTTEGLSSGLKVDSPPKGEGGPSSEHWLPLIGRAGDFRVLKAAWTAAKTQQIATLALVRGESGIGKSRLLVEIARLGAVQGARVFQIRCVAGDSFISFSSFRSALAEGMRRSDHERVDRRIIDLLNQIIERNDKVNHAFGLDSWWSRCVHAIVAYLTKIARFAPVLLSIDDVQWADEATLSVIQGIAGVPEGHAIGIVCASRPTNGPEDGSAKLLGAFGEFRGFRITLEPLANGSSIKLLKLLADRFDMNIPEHDISLLAKVANGNPLAMLESVRLYRCKEDQPRSGSDAEPQADGYHNHLAELVEQRISRLDARARYALEAIAVVGRRATVELTKSIVDCESSLFFAALDDLLAGGFIHEADQLLVIDHDYIRDVVYSKMRASRREALHRRAAAVAVESGQEMVEIAIHCERSGWRRMACWAGQQAARKALASSAYASAEPLLDLAERNADNDSERVELLDLRLELCVETHNYRGALRALRLANQRVRRGLTSSTLIRRHLCLVIALEEGARSAQALLRRWQELLLAVEADEANHGLLRCISQALAVAYDANEATFIGSVLETATVRARVGHNSKEGAELLATIARLRAVGGEFDEAVLLAGEAVEAARRLADPVGEVRGLLGRAAVLLCAGRLSEGMSNVVEAKATALSAELTWLNARITHDEGLFLTELGPLSDARNAFRQVVISGSIHEQVFALANLAAVEIEDSRFRELPVIADELEWRNSQLQAEWAKAVVGSIRGLYALHTADCMQAAHHLEAVDFLLSSGRRIAGDTSYIHMFRAQCLVQCQGDRVGASAYIQHLLDSQFVVDRLGRARLALQRASIIAADEPEIAWRLAKDVHEFAVGCGAETLRLSSDEILQRLR